MRYFFLMLVFLLVCFGLTFSVLMSPISSDKLNLVSAVGSSTDGAVANSEVQVFGSLEVSCNVLQGLSAGAAVAHGLLSAQSTCC
jgi:preprotein translocase subunit SecG